MAGKSMVISIDAVNRLVHNYSVAGSSRVSHQALPYSGNFCDSEFLTSLSGVFAQFAATRPFSPSDNVALVLPDSTVVTDVISVPSLGKLATKNSVQTSINGLYKNHDNLKFDIFQVMQTKQQSTFCFTSVREEVLRDMRTVCIANKINPRTITYAASAAVAGAASLSSRLRSSTYLFLDMKKDHARFSFVVKGRTVCFYTLPFGYEILVPEIAAEDMLFDHSVAELAVINARERARAKQLTMMADDSIVAEYGGDAPQEGDAAAAETPVQEPVQKSDEELQAEVDAAIEAENAALDAEYFEGEEEVPTGEPQTKRRVLKKKARKLPKFMLRPVPETQEGCVYENFRIFERWALGLLRANERLSSFFVPEAVYVNMPAEFNFLFDMVNAEKAENGVAFMSAGINANPLIRDNLEMYGALNAKNVQKSGIL